MGSMVTRPGLHRHAYAPMAQPRWVTEAAVTASVPGARPGVDREIYPVSQQVATFAADGAPFYVQGWQPGEAAELPGGRIPLRLPPVAAQIDLTDTTSWDRPVVWPGAI